MQDAFYTYRHNSTRDPLFPFAIDPDYLFRSADDCRGFVERCLDEHAHEYVIVEGEWSLGIFTGARVVG